MIKTKQPTNIKPEFWYVEYIKLHDQILYNDNPELIERERIEHEEPLNSYSHILDDDKPKLIIGHDFNQRIEELKDMDRKIIIYNQINEYEANFYDITPPGVSRKERRAKFYDITPPGVSKEDFNYYLDIIRGGKVAREPDLIFNCNSLEKNKGILELLKYRTNSIKLQPDINKLESYLPGSEERWLLLIKSKLKLCEKALNEDYLVTATLEEILSEIKEEEYSDYYEKKHPETVFDLKFRGFSYNESQIFELIKKKAKWHDIERDLTIYLERQNGKNLDELAENFGIKFNAVSMVTTKVQGAINYWKGKIFEDFIYKELQQSRLFEKVIKDAGKGEIDLLAYTNDGKELYIYSIKNIKINRKPYWLTIEELKPEIERARQCHWDYITHLILVVFDNLHNKVKQFMFDYNHPKNININ